MKRWLVVVGIVWLLSEGQAATGTWVPATSDEVGTASLARQAGFPEDEIERAVDVAECESGHRDEAVGDEHLAGQPTDDGRTWGNSIGRFQIRSIREAWGTGEPRDPSRLHDPEFNAWAAHEIWEAAAAHRPGQGWRRWTCAH